MNNNSFRDKLIRFMEGRYGADELFYILTGLYLLLVIVNVFAHSWILHIVGLIVFAITVYRTLSRKVERRTAENLFVMKHLNKAKYDYEKGRKRAAQKKDFYFKKCPGCKKMLRLPRVKGKHTTKCPACGKSFKVNIR